MTDAFKPGLQDWTPDQYHADPCPAPALSSSLARTILTSTPLHAWAQSPRLDDEYVRVEKTVFDVGSAVHKLYLGKGSKLKIINADAFNTKIAKTERDQAYSDGLTPLLKRQFADVQDMVAAGRFQLQKNETGDPFEQVDRANAEACFAWQSDGIWNRCMCDLIDQPNRIVWDLKTTGLTANPETLSRIVDGRGYDVQAAHYLDGLHSCLPDYGGGWKFRFVIQEKFYPFLLSVVELSDEWIDTARRKLKRAREVWRWCLESGVWPGYPGVICHLDQPTYSEGQWFEREIREDGVRQKTGLDVLALAMRWQAPT